MPQVYVCPLSRIAETVAAANASHLISLINDDTPVVRPQAIPEENHLFLGINDIIEPMDGMVLPAGEHVEQLIDFVGRLASGPPHRRPLLCRHQPVDRGGLHHALRAEAGARRGRHRAADARRLALRLSQSASSSRSATRSSGGRAAWSRRSRSIGRGELTAENIPFSLGLEE